MLGGVADNPAERLVSYVTSQRAALGFSLEIGDAVRRPLFERRQKHVRLDWQDLAEFLLDGSLFL